MKLKKIQLAIFVEIKYNAAQGLGTQSSSNVIHDNPRTLILKVFATGKSMNFLKVNFKAVFLRYCDEVVFRICSPSMLLMKLLDLFRFYCFAIQYFSFPLCFFPNYEE